LRMIPGGVGDKPSGKLLVAQLGNEVKCPASFERAYPLQVLRFEPELRLGLGIELPVSQHRRLSNLASEASLGCEEVIARQGLAGHG